MPASITKASAPPASSKPALGLDPRGPDRTRYKRTDLMPEGLTTTIYAAGGSFEKISRSDGSLDVKTYVGGFAIVTASTSGIAVFQSSMGSIIFSWWRLICGLKICV